MDTRIKARRYLYGETLHEESTAEETNSFKPVVPGKSEITLLRERVERETEEMMKKSKR